MDRFPTDSDKGAKNLVDIVVNLQRQINTLSTIVTSLPESIKSDIFGDGEDIGSLRELAETVSNNASTINGLLELAGSHVRYDVAQNLTDTEKAQARSNIGVDTLASDVPVEWSSVLNKPTFANVATSGNYNDLINKPTIPTIPASWAWNAISGKPTAFTPASHTHGKSEITDFPTLATVATSGSYNDLTNKPTIVDYSTDIANLNSAVAGNVKYSITQNLSDTQKSRARENIGAGTSSFDGNYNSLTNKPTIPSAVTESTVTSWGFTKNTGTYSKPTGGIPLNDLANDVKVSIGKADTALQSFTETDPVFSASVAASITSADITNWNGKTSNTGTYSKPTGGIPLTDLTVGIQSSLSKANTALQSFTETDPTVPAWAKAANKPTYTAAEVGALPSTTVIPTVPTNVSAFNNDSGYLTDVPDIIDLGFVPEIVYTVITMGGDSPESYVFVWDENGQYVGYVREFKDGDVYRIKLKSGYSLNCSSKWAAFTSVTGQNITFTQTASNKIVINSVSSGATLNVQILEN